MDNTNSGRHREAQAYERDILDVLGSDDSFIKPLHRLGRPLQLRPHTQLFVSPYCSYLHE